MKINKSETNGYYKIKNGPAKGLWLHFSMNALLNLQKDFNTTVTKVGEDMAKGDSFASYTGLACLIYSAAKAYAQENGHDLYYNYHNIIDWVSEIGFEETEDLWKAITWNSGGDIKSRKKVGKKKEVKN